jgi:hypothetical protein
MRSLFLAREWEFTAPLLNFHFFSRAHLMHAALIFALFELWHPVLTTIRDARYNPHHHNGRTTI